MNVHINLRSLRLGSLSKEVVLSLRKVLVIIQLRPFIIFVIVSVTDLLNVHLGLGSPAILKV